MTAADFATWVAEHRADAGADGWAVRPPTRDAVDACLAAAGAPAAEPLTAGAAATAGDVAVCAALADCPAALFPLALAAVRLVAAHPERTLGLANPWSPGPAAVPHHPVTVLSAEATRTHALWTGYGALSAPVPQGVGSIGRTVSLFLQRHVPAYRDNPPVFGHPGRTSFAVACHESLSVATPRHPAAYGAASAAVSGPRALYLGGAAGQVARLGLIIADGLLTALPSASASTRAALVVVNPTTTQDLATAGVTDLRDPVADAAERLVDGGRAIVAALDLLPVVAGGASQTWIAVAVGPPGSGWVFD